MKNKFLILSLLVSSFFTACSSDDDGASSEVNYPVTLTFKELGNSTLEYWKGGVLTMEDASKFRDYFEDEDCLEYFDEETDPYCKSTKIIFKNDTDLTFEFGDFSTDLQYVFENDTLKLIHESNKMALGVGNKEQLMIYGSLYKSNFTETAPCGGDEFHKFNFDGQFFFSAHENHFISLENPEDMEEEDEAVFYNREYILRK